MSRTGAEVGDPSETPKGAETALTKSIFLDVVGFTRDRTVEDQVAIVERLNRIVHESIEEWSVPEGARIVLPTGDGLCVCLLNLLTPYDLPLLLGVGILQRLESENKAEAAESRRFRIRVGINENIDNIIVDFNGRRNVAGAGISLAQRVMDKGDANQILVSEVTYRTLAPREKYSKKFIRHVGSTKHGEEIALYQYVDNTIAGLNCEVPRALAPATPRARRPLSDSQARYFALALYYEKALERAHSGDGTANWWVPVALATLADDEDTIAAAQPFERPFLNVRGFKTIAEVLAHFGSQDSHVTWLAMQHVEVTLLRGLEDCFKRDIFSNVMYSFLGEEGVRRLREERPGIMAALENGEWNPRIQR